MKRWNRQIFSILFFLFTVALVPALALAQSKYWIEFSNKGIAPTPFIPGNPLFEATRASLSLPCLHRRARALEEDEASTITIEDAPIYTPYLDSLHALGIKVLRQSKWSNAVSARMTDAQAAAILKLPFVRRLSPVGHGRPVSTQPISSQPASIARSLHAGLSRMHITSFDSGCGYDPIIYEYGDTEIGSTNRTDLDRINVWPLHAMGLDASGIRLGFLDVGFDTSVSSLDSTNVLWQYDYVFQDSNTANPEDEHGTETLSTAMGNLPDTMMGPAYKCSVMLAHTEDTRSEMNIEEDNYAEALEAMEAFGVQITSSSLGYFTFDSGQHSYTYADMNGHTAICTQSVERAAKLGVLVVTAMGNGGASSDPYVVAPADADSILACGALDVDDSIAGFSSRGPTSDGRMKPDICAPGVSVWAQGPLGNYGLLDGTSFATPLTSGSCCLIQQAHPEATAQQIRHAVMETGNNAAHPDTAYGWGKLNTYAAALALGTIIHPMQTWIDTAFHICAGIASEYPIKNATLTYFGDSDINPHKAQFYLAADSLIYSCTTANGPIALTDLGTHLYYQIAVVDGSGTTTASPHSGWNMLTIPGSSAKAGVDVLTENSLSSQIEVYPNPCSAQCDLNLSTSGEWRLVNANGSMMMNGSSQGPSTIRVPTSQLANGAYFIQFIATSGEIKAVPIVVIH